MNRLYRHIAELVRGIKVLFFPELCLVCRRKLADGERVICTGCRVTMPITSGSGAGRSLRERFDNHFDTVCAVSFFDYIHGSAHSRIVLDIKFRGCRRAAVEMGRWFGRRLREEGSPICSAGIIVPLPLSRVRLKERGFNQSELIARGISVETGVPVEVKAVARVRYSDPQSLQRSRTDRCKNVTGVFAVTDPELLAGRHIVIVDDVVTTGSTVTSCAMAILEAVPDCRISVAALSSVPTR